jgi:hypothetical protein
LFEVLLAVAAERLDRGLGEEGDAIFAAFAGANDNLGLGEV